MGKSTDQPKQNNKSKPTGKGEGMGQGAASKGNLTRSKTTPPNLPSSDVGKSMSRKPSDLTTPGRSPGQRFLVTHKSDNWKIRQAALQASREHSASKPQEEGGSRSFRDVPKHGTNTSDAKDRLEEPTPPRPKENNKDIENGHPPENSAVTDPHKSSMQGIMLRIHQREKTILLSNIEKVQHVPSSSSKDSVAKGKSSTSSSSSQSEGGYRAKKESSQRDPENQNARSSHEGKSSLAEGTDSSQDPDEVFTVDSGFVSPADKESTSTSIGTRPPLTSDDFDTDLEASDAEEEGRETSNRTLQTYKAACAKCHMAPNPSFMRQCGQSSIDLRNRMLTYREAKPIAIALVTDKRASTLDISENPLGPLGTAFVAEMIYANNSVLELNLSNTQPGREGLAALVQTLANNVSLRRLYLGDNGLQQGEGDLIAELIMTAPELRELYLNNNTLGFTGTKKIAQALASNKGRLSVLDLQYNNIRTDSAVQIALALAKNTTLRCLNLAWNGFGYEGCRALAMSLGANSTLRELDLTCNRLGLKSLEHLIKGLNKNTGLACIKLGSNPLTTEGAKALITAIASAQHSALTDIDLQDIPIDLEFLQLTEKLKSSRIIQVFHDTTVHMATTDQTRENDGSNITRFDPVMVLFEYMKKDNLRVQDLFQFFDTRRRDKLSKSDLRDGINVLMIPFTEHAIDEIMKAIDIDKDGYITLDEMMKAYRENDRAVKLRRIKASQKHRTDYGLEDLWKLLKDIIEKRKAEIERRVGDG